VSNLATELDAHAARVRRQLERVSGALPGVQYAMTDADATRFEHCAGFADVGSRRAVTTETQFMAASCTKVVTAAAVRALVGAGRVELSGSLSDYYPDHPYGRDVTVCQLLAHTAGVPNPLPVNWLHPIDDAAFDEEVALAAVLRAHPRLRSAPGARYSYSNLGYWLLGKVIERASGLRYERYVQDAVLAPLGGRRHELTFAVEDRAMLARGYERAWSALGVFARLAVRSSLRDGRDGEWLRFARVYMDGPAYGGLMGTARGFCRFLRGQIAHAASLSLGWRAGELAGVGYYGKPGGGPGFCGNVRVYPSLGIATAWFANRMAVSEGKLVAFTDSVDGGWLPAWRPLRSNVRDSVR
jgi:CubicO group peptidase (beta-lactamase class C family)